jgi:hypothetical protein
MTGKKKKTLILYKTLPKCPCSYKDCPGVEPGLYGKKYYDTVYFTPTCIICDYESFEYD